jgi:hypothetical protein
MGEYQVILQTSEIRNRTLVNLSVVYGSYAFKQSTLMGTINLKKVEGFLEDEERSIRPAASRNEEKVGKVHTFLTSYMCVTIEQIADRMIFHTD